MTKRAIVIGLVLAVVLCCITYFNQSVMRQTPLVGDYLPISVYGSLILGLLLLNPALRRLRPAWQFKGPELAVILTLVLTACGVAEYGILKTFTNVVMLPRRYRKTNPAWDHEGVFERLPAHMLAGTSVRFREDDILEAGGMCAGLASGGAGGTLAEPRKRIWQALSVGHRQAIAEAGRAAAAGVDEAVRKRVIGRVHGLLAEDAERAREEEKEQTADAERRYLTGGQIEDVTSAAAEILTGWRPGAPSTSARLRELDEMMKKLNVSPRARAEAAEAVRAGLAGVERHCRRAAAAALDSLLDDRELYDREAFSGATLSTEAEELLAREMGIVVSPDGGQPPGVEDTPEATAPRPERIVRLDARDVRALNRFLIEAAWPDEIYSHTRRMDDEIDGFVQGKTGDAPVSPGDVPWNAWLTPIFTWLPVVLLITVGFIALALVMHRQWSQHEHLPYPISTFARSLWGGEGGGSVFSQRGFWIAACVVLGIHLVNFAHGWWPQHTVAIPTQFNFYPIAQLFPTFIKGGGFAWSLSQLRIYFCVIGFAYLVSSDVSLSFAVAPFIYAISAGILATYGISTGAGGEHRASIYTSVNIGSFVAFVGMILYFGRRHYWAVFRRAFGLAAADKSESHEVWGMRTFLVCSVLATVLMVVYGLAWPFAIVYMLSVVVFYVGVSRVVAETGLFFMKPAWVPHIVLLGVFGTRALGPTAALVAMFFSAVLFAEAKQLVMPYVANSLHMLSREGVKPGRVVAWSAVAVTLGLVAGLVVTLCLQYNKGTDMAAGGWFTHTVPSYPFRISADMSQRLRSQGTFEESDSMPSWRRPLAARPEKKFAISFIVGAALVVICYIGRLRIAGWPFHPAVLLLWNWFHVSKLTFSFFLGWAIKKGVTRYGGIEMVQRLKPVMIGLIAGEMLGGFIPAIISAIYYFATGETPKAYLVMPAA